MNAQRLLALITLTLFCLCLPAAAADRWFHVHVEDDGETVNVNVPLSVAEGVLPAIDIDELNGGKLQIDDLDLDGFDLQQMLAALRDAPDANFVTVKSDDESVRVAKEGGFLTVAVEEHGRSGDSVNVRLPMKVVEALVGDRPGELDLQAGLAALADYDGEDLVTVSSRDGNVRVWIDSNQSQ